MSPKPMTPDQMRDAAKRNSPFVKLEDGESVRITLKSCIELPQQQDPSKSTYRYTVEDENGDEKFFESASNSLLDKMADLMGKHIVLKRSGTGNKTTYDVKAAE